MMLFDIKSQVQEDQSDNATSGHTGAVNGSKVEENFLFIRLFFKILRDRLIIYLVR